MSFSTTDLDLHVEVASLEAIDEIIIIIIIINACVCVFARVLLYIIIIIIEYSYSRINQQYY